MKKFLSCVLALTIICTVVGFATATTLTFDSKKGQYAQHWGIKKKAPVREVQAV